MLEDLYLLQTYFAEAGAAIYEDDLIARYGRTAVDSAIDAGLLEHRRIPCGTGGRRCVCRLSPLGLATAEEGARVVAKQG